VTHGYGRAGSFVRKFHCSEFAPVDG
jgi:hypothetical protein